MQSLFAVGLAAAAVGAGPAAPCRSQCPRAESGWRRWPSTRARPGRAGARAPLAAAALALPLAGRRRAAARAAGPAGRRIRAFAEEVAAGNFGLAGVVGEPARTTRRSPCSRRAEPGRASCTASAGCAISRRASIGRDASGGRAQSGAATGSARGTAAGRSRLGARGRGPRASSPGLRTPACCSMARAQALRRHHAQLAAIRSPISSAAWRNAPDGYPRLLALIGAGAADCALPATSAGWRARERLLVAELERQILPDGGHISRNPALLVELLLDLLPLRQCFPRAADSRRRALADAIERMIADAASPAPRRRHAGALQRHGRHASATRWRPCLAYDEPERRVRRPAPRSGYAPPRSAAAPWSSSMPAPPPPLGAAPAQRCAGCLSFEMSAGSEPLLVNGGAPRPAHESPARRCARATASHNTLCLERAVVLQADARRGAWSAQIGCAAAAASRPRHLRVRDGERRGIALEASHDGYVEPFGLLHTRTPDARCRDGTDGSRACDRLSAAKGVAAACLGRAVRHPLPPASATPRPHRTGARHAPTLLFASGEHLAPDGQRGARLSIEDSMYFADASGPRAPSRSCCAGRATATMRTALDAGADQGRAWRSIRAAARLPASAADGPAGRDRRGFRCDDAIGRASRSVQPVSRRRSVLTARASCE